MVIDFSSSDGLITQSATICEVSTTYTFTGDGKSVGIGGEPQEGYYFQLQAIDDAGNRSKLSPANYVYHDTVEPKKPEIIFLQDEIQVKGEKWSEYSLSMSSPSGVLTIESSGILDENGELQEKIDKKFTSEFGAYTVQVSSYDSAGNFSQNSKSIQRSADNSNPCDIEVSECGGGGEGLAPKLAQAEVDLLISSGGKVAISNPKILPPVIVSANQTATDQFNISGMGYSLGDKVKLNIQLDSTYLYERASKYNCIFLSWWSYAFNICVNNVYNSYLASESKRKFTRYGTMGENFIIVKSGANINEFVASKGFAKTNLKKEMNNNIIQAQSKIKISAKIDASIKNNVTSGIIVSSEYLFSPFTPNTILGNSNQSNNSVNVPMGMPVNDLQDSDIGQGPGGSFSHIDGDNKPISAVDYTKSEKTEILATMDGHAELKKNMPIDSHDPRAGTCYNTYPNSKVWGCYVTVTNSSTGYLTLNAHLNYEDAIKQYGKIGGHFDVKNRQKIGNLGNTGYSTNAHGHYEIRKGNVGTVGFFNGMPYVAEKQADQRSEMSHLTGLTMSQLSH